MSTFVPLDLSKKVATIKVGCHKSMYYNNITIYIYIYVIVLFDLLEIITVYVLLFHSIAIPLAN